VWQFQLFAFQLHFSAKAWGADPMEANVAQLCKSTPKKIINNFIQSA